MEAVERHASVCFVRVHEPCHVAARLVARPRPRPAARACTCMIPDLFSRTEDVLGVQTRAFRDVARRVQRRACSMRFACAHVETLPSVPIAISTRSIEISPLRLDPSAKRDQVRCHVSISSVEIAMYVALSKTRSGRLERSMRSRGGEDGEVQQRQTNEKQFERAARARRRAGVHWDTWRSREGEERSMEAYEEEGPMAEEEEGEVGPIPVQKLEVREDVG